MSKAARFKAALFARAIPLRPGEAPVEDRLAALRAAAHDRGYEVALERTNRDPPSMADAWIHDLLDAADAGNYHALLIHNVRDLSPSLADANWLLDKLALRGIWIVQIGTVPGHTLSRPPLAGS